MRKMLEQTTLDAWQKEFLDDDNDMFGDRDRDLCKIERDIARKAGLKVKKDLITVTEFYSDDVNQIKDHTWVLRHTELDDAIFVLYHNKVPVAGWYASFRGGYIFDGYVKKTDRAYRSSDDTLHEVGKEDRIPRGFINRLDPNNPYLVGPDDED
jgi:hypothetical protein